MILINHSDKPFEIKNGERIAQLVLNKVEQINWVPVVSKDELEQSERGEGGFGSTGR